MTTLRFDLLERIDIEHDLLINGYIRLFIGSNDCIPQIIASICLLFYLKWEYFTCRYPFLFNVFDTNIVKLNRGPMEMYRLCSKNDLCDVNVVSVYGNLLIHNKIFPIKYVWTFKTKLKTSMLGIGIIENFNDIKKRHCGYSNQIDHKALFYSFAPGVGKSWKEWSMWELQHGDEWRYSIDCQKYGVSTTEQKEWYTIKMELFIASDTKSILKYYVDDIDQGIAFKNIQFHDNEQYYMVVELERCKKGESEVRFIDFYMV